jgi:hypothetical protein
MPRKRSADRSEKWRAKAAPFEKTGVIPMKYHALEDPLFPGTWRAEPLDYAGRGIVYLFRSEAEAWACAKRKTKQFLESRR